MTCLVWVRFLELELTSGNCHLAKLGKAKRVAQDWQGQSSAVGSEQGCRSARLLVVRGLGTSPPSLGQNPGTLFKDTCLKGSAGDLLPARSGSVHRSGSRAGELWVLEDVGVLTGADGVTLVPPVLQPQ